MDNKENKENTKHPTTAEFHPEELKTAELSIYSKIRVYGEFTNEEANIFKANIREAYKNKGVRVDVAKKYYNNVTTLHIYTKGAITNEPRKGHNLGKKYNMTKKRAKKEGPKKEREPTGRPVGCPLGTKHKQHKPHIFTKPRKDKGLPRKLNSEQYKDELLNNLKQHLPAEEFKKFMSYLPAEEFKIPVIVC